MSEPMMQDKRAVAAAIAEVEADYNVDVVAIVAKADGQVEDYVFTWEAGINYANQGYRVTALKPDGHIPVEVMQRAFDDELRLAVDCFGDERVR